MGIAKALAAKNGYELDSNQEVITLKLYIDRFFSKISYLPNLTRGAWKIF